MQNLPLFLLFFKGPSLWSLLLVALLASSQATVAQSNNKITHETLLETAGPTIEIKEPDITVTRSGPAILVASDITQSTEIKGKVKPTTNLKEFSINGQTHKLNADGTFTYRLSGTADKVHIVVLDKNGHETDLSLKIRRYSSAAGVNAIPTDYSAIAFGEYHALIIGNSEHEHLQTLETSRDDAIALEAVLSKKFGFATRLLLNATRGEILSAFNDYRNNLVRKDNLLVFYSGHRDLAFDKVFWLPVDAEQNIDTNWIPEQQISQYCETMLAKHIVVIADFVDSTAPDKAYLPNKSDALPIGSDSLLDKPLGLTPEQEIRWFEETSASKVRTMLSTGDTNSLIIQQGNKNRSLFSTVLIDELTDDSDPVLSTYSLFLKIQTAIQEEARRSGVEQNTQYSPMEYSGHESGDFLFVQKQYLNKQ